MNQFSSNSNNSKSPNFEKYALNARIKQLVVPGCDFRENVDRKKVICENEEGKTRPDGVDVKTF